VVVPATNLPNLMLRADVVAAVRAGRFAVWAVSTVDEALELLTGLPAGVPGEDGSYPADTVNGRVAAGLDALAARALEFMAKAGKSRGGGRSGARRSRAPGT
jgi:predicted ATP-dependent protease